MSLADEIVSGASTTEAAAAKAEAAITAATAPKTAEAR